MRKSLLVIVLILIISGAFVSSKSEPIREFSQKYLYVSRCSEPIYYKLGIIDPRFGLSEDEVKASSQKAADIWNLSTNKRLFEYHPNGKLTINMVYDYRQSLNTQIDQLETDLDNGKTTLNQEQDKFTILSANFDARRKLLNEKVDDWNRRQDGTQEEYEKLVEEQKSVRDEAEKLNLIARQLNINTRQYNDKITDLNQTIGTFNSALAKRPEEGIYDPNTNTINIYFNNDEEELERTIAHELGHARGLGHINDENAIMYPKTTRVLTPTIEELSKISEICEDFPIYEPYIENFKNNFILLIASLK